MARLKTEKGKKQKPKASQKNEEKAASNSKKLQAKSVAQSSKSKADSLQLDASPRWYDDVPSLQPIALNAATLTPEKLSSLLDRATSLHANVVNASQSTSTVTSSSSDYNFLRNILQTGTLSDRLSALTLLVQSSPLHNTRALEALKNMAERGKGKGGRGESLKALRCVVDWWVGGGAPDRKLKYFRDQPLSHPDINDRHLVIWYFEDWLKKYFFSVLQILEVLSADPLSYVRMQALSLVFTLLKEKPEQEQNLLRLLINKLGDSDKTICSRSSYYILQLLQVHPSMKAVVVREITSLVLRPGTSTAATAPPTQNAHIRFNKDGLDPNPKPQPKSKSKADPAAKQPVNEHARYYASITLNQIMFRPNEKDVAMQTIDVYFRLFEDILGEGRLAEEENDDARSEVSQAHDKSKQKRKGKEVVGEGGFTEVEDSLSKLLSAILTGVNRALPFAKLGATDSSLGKHIDTLFLITHKSTFNISLQALVLIQQISSSLINQSKASPSSSSQSKSITDRYYRALYASLYDGRLASSSKQTMYLNLLFKSLKADGNVERIKSFVRRFVQVLVSGGAGGNEFIVGGLYLLGEIFSTLPGLRNLLHGAQNVHEDDIYDPRKRDPQYARPSTSPLFELLPLMHHYHPTVSLHARQLFTSQPITSAADLNLNTLSHFLDRFIYKNPKKLRPKGSSAMQPSASAADGVGVKKTKGDMGDNVLPNEEKFWKKREEDVRVDEVFFHRYFSQKHRRSKVTKRENGEEGDESDEGTLESDDELSEEGSLSAGDFDAEEEGEESDLDEKAIWKAMKATMPAMEGDDELPSELDDEDEGLPSEQGEEDEDFLSQQDDEGDEDMPSEQDDEEDKDIPFEHDDEDDEEVEVEKNEASDRGDADEPDDAFSLAEASDDDDLLAVGDIPGLIEYDGSDVPAEDSEEDDEQPRFGGSRDKRKRKGKGEDKERKRKKRKTLPTFASYEDYAKMIEDGPEDNI
ncbi:hypothetical protein PISMIDRAFT_88728 [Pisolithus microcarpus 441]|uniref:CCAAT-binding factor domain-containing protein n=1 Tax=Pisolithus microcarpus 441 TaxID=765257 RepID=A0A0D0A5C7_9AGAM|nr:ribosome biogenesis protein [Pisolithus microcarpus]KIK29577.1 hypothetical protein PISMIDRAFT_88728 [Pisolithus microcarpus 441]